jgi:putative transposase
MIIPTEKLSLTRQCLLLKIPRSVFYFVCKGESAYNLKLMRMIDEKFMEKPYFGSRQMMKWLRLQGYNVGRKRIRRLMKLLGLEAIYQKPNTSKHHPEHKIYPYLLRHFDIIRPNQVWCSDITYIPVQGGFLYLVVIMDWYTRKVLSWRLSNSMEASFCVEALDEALSKYPKPEIFNTDQGSQFTGYDWIETLQDAKVKISMDGKGRWMDNVFIERLWRSLKYECVYLYDFADGREARSKIGAWIKDYNEERPHSALDGVPPDWVYYCSSDLNPMNSIAA